MEKSTETGAPQRGLHSLRLSSEPDDPRPRMTSGESRTHDEHPVTTVEQQTDSPPAPLSQQDVENGYTSTIPWEDTPADCVVICCSDPRFERQNEDFVNRLGYSQPHFIQIPSGLAVFHSLVTMTSFLHKGMGLLLKKAVELTNVSTIVCIGHEDCGGYKSGKHEIIRTIPRRLAGKSIREIQVDHLKTAGRSISRQLGGNVEVRVFYADVVNSPDHDGVKFTEIQSWGRKQRGTLTATEGSPRLGPPRRR